MCRTLQAAEYSTVKYFDDVLRSLLMNFLDYLLGLNLEDVNMGLQSQYENGTNRLFTKN